MATISDLRAHFDAVINSIDTNTTVHLNRNVDDAFYAVYVFGLVLEAAKLVATPNSLCLRSINSGLPLVTSNTFTVRGAPGYIYSSNHDYGYAHFDYKGQGYEIHLGVRYIGSSDVLHEFDISIIRSDDAQRCRQNRESPGSGKPKYAIECKFYTDTIGIELGREIVGLVADFPSIPITRLVTNSHSDSVTKFLNKKQRPKFNGQVTPQNPTNETMLINSIADDIRTKLN